MLSDLVQYFTKTDEDYEEFELVEFLRFIHENTCDEEIKDKIELSVHNPDNFIDLFEYGFNEENYMNDIHLGDALDMNYENVLLTMILSTVLDTEQFIVRHEDIEMSFLIDENCIEENYKISNFAQYDADRKINFYINDFILSNIKDYEIYDKPGYVDEYCAETKHFIISYIKFMNKSLARKIRKAYTTSREVRCMFNNLNYYMVNGEFVFLEQYNIECVSYDGYHDMENVYLGIDELRRIIGITNKNEEKISFKRAMKIMNDEFYEYCNAGSNERFFEGILKLHAIPENEVIL